MREPNKRKVKWQFSTSLDAVKRYYYVYVVALRVLIVIWLLHETISANRVLHQLEKTREMNVGKAKDTELSVYKRTFVITFLCKLELT